MLKKLIIAGIALVVLGIAGVFLTIRSIKAGLPQLITVKDYQPVLVTEIFDRNNKKIGELYNERRILVPYDQIPKNLINAFLAAEDDQFFQHKGINYQAILRATFANLRAGRTVQGGSTITQQVAKTLLLRDNEKTLLRKVKEAFLSQQMEENLRKEDILYLYLNQIFFGERAYGIEVAAQTYFHKSVAKLTLPEMAILAGLPQAPSRYSPVKNPLRAKERQTYVLHRMAEVGFITKEEAEEAIKQPVKVYFIEKFNELAPFYVETVRQQLVAQLGNDQVLDKGLRIYTGLDLENQLAAQESVVNGLKELDKRQGFRGPLKELSSKEDIEKFLVDGRKRLIAESTLERIIMPDGKFAEIVPARDAKHAAYKNIPTYLKVGQSLEALVEKVDDQAGLVYVRVAETRGLIDYDSMTWARKPNPDKRWDSDLLKKVSDAVKAGDVILVKITGDVFSSSRLSNPAKNKKQPATPLALPDFAKFVEMELDQEPLVEGSLISFDEQTEDVLAMVGGYSYARNEFNRALQAARQTGSSFKTIVYASALDKGYNPSTPIMDAPIVFEEGGDPAKDDSEGQEDAKVWKPANHSKSFGGEISFRNSLVKSLNIPSVKIIEDIGVPWAADYAKRLGIFSPLNPDFTLVLGSSSVTLYEMTKAFGQFARLGKRLKPRIIHKVLNQEGQKILDEVSLDVRFDKELSEIDKQFEERRTALAERVKNMTPEQIAEDKKKKVDYNFFFEDKDQLIKPQTAYIMTTLLKGVVEDRNGTGGRARSIGREVAGKTGSTNGYFDAWFIGYTPQVVTGVWVGFDKERSIGKGEVGGRAALPIWVEYMKVAHEGLPQMTFPIPEGIVFANIDSDTGKLATASTKNVLRQAFAEGSEPTAASNKSEEATDFLKEDLSE
ncbi:penicillin-binding protein 1A [Bdellovibrio sp. HCB337]|uniref:penicillin-binding protein 1A n=1 Tax=Bdellovibrio sp. HCB337 TaxID=3394358 RepID=UPI0039A7879E